MGQVQISFRLRNIGRGWCSAGGAEIAEHAETALSWKSGAS